MFESNVFTLKIFKHWYKAEYPIFLFSSKICFFFTIVIDFLFQEVDEDTPNSTFTLHDFVPYRTGTTYRAKQIRIRFQPGENDIRRVFEANFQAGIQKLCSVLQYTLSCFLTFLFYVKL